MVIDRPLCLPSVEAIRNYRIAENEVLNNKSAECCSSQTLGCKMLSITIVCQIDRLGGI